MGKRTLFVRLLSACLALASLYISPPAGAVAQDTVINTFNFPNENPSATAISPDGTFAIVTTVSGTVYRINLTTNTVTDTITVANGGYRTAFDANARYAYLINQSGNLVYKMDLTNNSIVATISGIPSPRGVAASPDGSYMIITSNWVNRNYYKVDVNTDSVTTYSNIFPVNVFEVSIAPNGAKAIFGSFSSNQFHLVDLTTNTLIRSYNATGSGFSQWTPDSSAIYGCHQQGSNFYKIDPASTSITTYTLPGGGCTSLAIAPDNSYILFSAASGAVYRYLTTNLNSVAATISGFSALAWDIKIGTNQTAGVFALLTDRTNRNVYRIFESGGVNPVAPTFTLTSAAVTAVYRAPLTLTASSSAAGKVTFYADGKRIAGCISRVTVFSSTNAVTCSWKPTARKVFRLNAVVSPTDSSYLKTTSNTIFVSVSSRAGTR